MKDTQQFEKLLQPWRENFSGEANRAAKRNTKAWLEAWFKPADEEGAIIEEGMIVEGAIEWHHLMRSKKTTFDICGLRVYNVFKCWLESHWRDLSDHKALSVNKSLAHEKLSIALPRAGRRLLELTEKVPSSKGPLVPRLVSSMAKTSTPIAQYVPADMLLPPSNMTKSQATALKYWKMGGSNPTILEFDLLELARQLTIKEMKIFRSIMPKELLGSEWTKRLGSGAPNIRAMSTLSTDISNLVTDTVLQYKDVKKRVATIKQSTFKRITTVFPTLAADTHTHDTAY